LRGIGSGVIAVAACSLFAAGAEDAGFRYEEYLPSTLAGEIAAHPHDPGADRWIEGGDFRYRFRVTLAGRSRPLEKAVDLLLDEWAKALGHPRSTRALFKHEVLVREGDNEYWLPIQEPLMKPLAKEVKPGGELDLYVMRLGSLPAGVVFVINEFMAFPPPQSRPAG